MFSLFDEFIDSDKKNNEDLFLLNSFKNFNFFNYDFNRYNQDNEHFFPSRHYCDCCCGNDSLNSDVENEPENNFTNNNNNNQDNNINNNNNTNSNSNNNINPNNNNINSNSNNNEGMQ